MNIYNYVYKITNSQNGKWYIGVHSTDNLDDGYMGSGTYIRRAIKKYGKEKFTKDIIKFFDNRDSAFEFEKNIVTEEVVKSSYSYNGCVGGSGAVGTLPKSEEHKLNISIAQKRRYKENGNPTVGQVRNPASEERKRKVSDANKGKPSPFKGKERHSNATKQKMSESAKNRALHKCPKCGCELQKANLSRHHGLDGEKCKKSF